MYVYIHAPHSCICHVRGERSTVSDRPISCQVAQMVVAGFWVLTAEVRAVSPCLWLYICYYIILAIYLCHTQGRYCVYTCVYKSHPATHDMTVAGFRFGLGCHARLHGCRAKRPRHAACRACLRTAARAAADSAALRCRLTVRWVPQYSGAAAAAPCSPRSTASGAGPGTAPEGQCTGPTFKESSGITCASSPELLPIPPVHDVWSRARRLGGGCPRRRAPRRRSRSHRPALRHQAHQQQQPWGLWPVEAIARGGCGPWGLRPRSSSRHSDSSSSHQTPGHHQAAHLSSSDSSSGMHQSSRTGSHHRSSCRRHHHQTRRRRRSHSRHSRWRRRGCRHGRRRHHRRRRL